MASERQVRANRENALRSTGPRTEEGKAAVGKNALKHGLLSSQVLLPDEDEGAFREFRDRLYERLRPEGELEELLADRVCACAWRLRRLIGVEAALLGEGRSPAKSFDMAALAHNGDVFSKLSRYEAAIERGLFKALHELQRLQAERRGEDVAPPAAVDVEVTVVPEEGR
jgi:hypothetical protein